MPCWPVSHQDGIYVVTDSDGIVYPITMARLPVKVLQAGWYPIGLQTGLKPFHLLELRNDNGPDRDAVWYLADDLEFICNAAGSFLPEHGEPVIASLSPLLRDIHEQSLCAPETGLPLSSHAFDGINPRFTRDLIGFVVDTALNPPEVVALDPLERISAQYVAGDAVLSVKLLRHSLDMPAPNQLLDGLTLASPFDASLLTAQDQFVPETGSADGLIEQAYRFHDPAAATTLYLLICGGRPALYIPAINTVFAVGEGLTGAQVLATLLSYYASHADRRPAARPQEATAQAVQADALTSWHEPAERLATAAHGNHGQGGLLEEAVDHSDAAPGESGSWLDAPTLPEADAKPRVAAAPPTTWWKRLFGLGQS